MWSEVPRFHDNTAPPLTAAEPPWRNQGAAADEALAFYVIFYITFADALQ
jgi:hypothetical protein